jgi:predicted MFS family arabinose efflux permease
VGSAAGGLLYDLAWLPDASFLVMAAVTGLGVVLSLVLPRMLGQRADPADSPGAPRVAN